MAELKEDKLVVPADKSSANKKVKVSVEDEFGIVQHMLWRYCEIHPSEFKMNKKFEVEILID